MKIDTIEPDTGEEFDIGSFTVLVGPNNTGKTQTLSDIHSLLTTNNPRTTVVNDVEIEGVDGPEGILGPLNLSEHPSRENHKVVRDFGSNPQSGGNQQFREGQIENWIEHDNMENVMNQLGQFHVFYLDASSRLEIAKSGSSHDAQNSAPTTLLQKLYESDEDIERKLRDAFKSTFGMEIRLDYSSLQTLSFRIADNFEDIPDDPREARDIMSQYRKLDDQGHGFRSFVGVVLSLLLSSHRVVLMDEPEAFLHPAQARDLGRWIADHSNEISGQVILATHDSDFLSGVLSGGSDIRILRLNRPSQEETYYQEIPPGVTEEFAEDPLLSSQRVVESVFHRGVIICEGGSDRSVYRAVGANELGYGDLLFVDALGVNSIKKISSTVGGAYTPKTAITDLDILDDHHEFRYLLESMREGLEYDDIQDELDDRRRIDDEIRDETDWQTVKSGGVNAIPESVRDLACDLIDDCKEYGLFIVPVGELEGWMDLGVSKGRWGPEALDMISEGDCDENLAEFVSEACSKIESQYGNMPGME